ncbi:uncharacterized protein F5Z01DRAFT_677709 [Emericellopsis atlantica]|uniref:Uncharacterized protein n=1 Tax=Emericellopsis atlantica TaxID=2614577 RepID=A0A9P7ZEC5_9HYPO|nr:uncharacterized protein F5Z01DRAFT_677709 [Emericellopsis atlantica]KAG9250583.1 hypothetical protein F5Z01DRAFT_677709 [Emericellopsis atlantica]
MLPRSLLALGLYSGLAAALESPQPTQAPAYPPVHRRQNDDVKSITDCHLHGSALYCIAGSAEYSVSYSATQTTDLPSQFTDCHSHDSDFYCVDENGDDVAATGEGGHEEEADHTEEEEEGSSHEGQDCHFHAGIEHCVGDDESEESTETESEDGGQQHCHFHAGVEHCVGEGESENGGESAAAGGSSSSSSSECSATPREYNVGLRVGLLFAILATSALGVFGPILLQRYMPRKLNLLFVLLKQFGTGIIISTAFVHLYTHATLMFSQPCVGALGYEGTTSALVMAGIFLSFLVEWIGNRVVLAKIKSEAALTAKERSRAMLSSEVVSVLVMEAGILFHSLLIGLTLVVAGDSYFLTLFIVIVFHQIFEGLALGTRIGALGTGQHIHTHGLPDPATDSEGNKTAETLPIASSSSSSSSIVASVSLRKKLILASLFAFITPIGMAIGIGVLNQFNGRDKSTLIAIGTLDAVSAGILVWVGCVEMWSADWMTGAHGKQAELANADWITTSVAFFGLIAGMVVMSVLGKWA